jgi:hypothetical protein
MNIKKMVRKINLWPALLLSFCTTDPLPDEDYEAPTIGQFPLLGTVPDRPSFPEASLYQDQRQRLQKSHDYAHDYILEKQTKAQSPE